MLSDTLTEGLERYRIGPKLRRLRLKKSMGLKQLSDQTGLSPALLSKIERGQMFPTLPTLLRVALAFGVGLEFFFDAGDKGPVLHVVRKTDRVRLPDRADADPVAYYFESLDFPLPNRKTETYLAEFPVTGGVSRPHHHPGIELVYVIKGQLRIDFADTSLAIGEGDAASFDGAAEHSYCREGRGPATAIVSIGNG
jgi:transcriptional regulator with XRE-family HTH domain